MMGVTPGFMHLWGPGVSGHRSNARGPIHLRVCCGCAVAQVGLLVGGVLEGSSQGRAQCSGPLGNADNGREVVVGAFTRSCTHQGYSIRPYALGCCFRKRPSKQYRICSILSNVNRATL